MPDKIILVTRKTRLEELVERFNTRPQARFYIEHSGGNFDWYEREHETYYAALSHLRKELALLAKLQVIERSFLPNFIFAEDDLVVTIGIDGLVVNTAKYLHGQPLVAVNPDREHIDGVLLPFDVSGAPAVVRKVIKGQAAFREITMAEACLNDGQTLLAFNDLFIGVKSHISARYRIQIEGRQEDHSSSGIIVSTGAGSTGWLSSLFNMADGLWKQFGDLDNGAAAAAGRLARPGMDWETDRLIYVVREPFASKTSGATIVCGSITRQAPLVLESHMPEGGVIFSDGIEADYLAFNSGAVAKIGLAEKKTRLVIDG
ncbi:MAG: NAD+ kinase [Chloroflexota bacterium]|nr:MAG: NAD+ kinase [Chloroflexota bacterium]